MKMDLLLYQIDPCIVFFRILPCPPVVVFGLGNWPRLQPRAIWLLQQGTFAENC